MRLIPRSCLSGERESGVKELNSAQKTDAIMELTRLQDVTVQARKYYSMQIPVNRNSSFGSNV